MIIHFPNIPYIPQETCDKLTAMGVTFTGKVENTEIDIVDKLSHSEILVCNFIELNEARLKKLTNLKHLVTPSIGYNWIDIKAAKQLGITVSNCPSFCINTTAEHAVTLTLATLRQIKRHCLSSKEKSSFEPGRNFELCGKTVGIIGYGNIGKQVAKLLSGFEVSVKAVNSRSTEADIRHTLKSSDIIIMTLPLNENTRNFMSEDRIGLLKTNSIVVNVGREYTIDETALYTSIADGKLAGAGLDVTSNESPGLLGLPRVIYTSHTGYASLESLSRKGSEIIEVLESCLTHEPINVVN